MAASGESVERRGQWESWDLNKLDERRKRRGREEVSDLVCSFSYILFLQLYPNLNTIGKYATK